VAILIRAVEPDDIPAMAAIRAARSHNDAFWIDRIGRYLTGEHTPQHALPERAVFVAIEEKELVGFVAGHRTRRLACDGELQWIDVAEEKRGQGIADKLMAAIGEWFVGEGLMRICVNVDPANLVARRLYAKHGAQPLNEQWMVWTDAGRMGSTRPG
jgi:GNAT superfamily N-acetyltransferase